MKPILILCSTPNYELAQEICDLLISQNLAACAQILPGITSIYKWEGKLMKETESLILLKTIETKAKEIEETILLKHPYSVPEVLSLSIESLNEKYSEWLLKSING